MEIAIIIGTLLVFLSILIRKEGYYELITGYDSTAKPETDANKLAVKNTATIILIIGIISIIIGVLGFYNRVDNIILYLIDILIIFMLLSLMKSAKNEIIPKIIAVILFIGTIVFNVFIYLSTISAKLDISKNKYLVTGLYSLEDHLIHIEKIDLIHKKPIIIKKINGFSFNEIHKGRFNIKGEDNVYLNIISDKPPFLYIKSSKLGSIYLNSDTSNLTIKYYNILLKR